MIRWLLYGMARGKFLVDIVEGAVSTVTFHSKALIDDWAHFVRQARSKELAQQPWMGGAGEEVQIDEILLRGRRKCNRDLLLQGNNVPPRWTNYGDFDERGPQVVRIISLASKELRMAVADCRDSGTADQEKRVAPFPRCDGRMEALLLRSRTEGL